MLRTPLFHLLSALEQVCTIPWLLYGLWLERRGRMDDLRRLGARRNRIFSRLHLAWGGVSVRVHGSVDVPPGKGALVVANHQSAFDIPILGRWIGRDVAFIAKIELSRVPIAGTWMRFMGCHFIDRADRRQSLGVFKTAAADLQQGSWLVIFPEGTRSGRQEMAPFKRGSLSLALKAGVNIVPVAISSSWKIRGRGRGIRAGVVDLHILPSIDPTLLPPDGLEGLTARIQSEIATLLGVPAPAGGGE